MARRHSSYYDDYWPRYTPTQPIAVRDGIKARSRSGKFVKNWWADRWIGALTRLMDSKRLSRGRSYARRGQVLDIDLGAGRVTARVQGSRRTPYKVNIQLQPLSDDHWNRVFDALAEQALFAAQLLNGEMPPDIEQVFESVNVPLFPASRGDLKTDCTCPDWANPCKHVAAVYYLLGERFDQDPFLLFELRGRTEKEVAAALRERRAQAAGALEEAPAPYLVDALEAVEAAPLGDCLDHYWILGDTAQETTLNVSAPEVSMALLKRLGMPDFLEAQRFWTQMERVYDGVTAHALEIAFAPGRGAGGPGISPEEELAVLKMVEEQKISAAEANILLDALGR
jgi:uncharacterized Zn finger protein